MSRMNFPCLRTASLKVYPFASFLISSSFFRISIVSLRSCGTNLSYLMTAANVSSSGYSVDAISCTLVACSLCLRRGKSNSSCGRCDGVFSACVMRCTYSWVVIIGDATDALIFCS